ncbi:MAG: flagellar regulator YcgR PilZN domain-containing protein, partial [Pseudomonadota bacterium]
MDIPHPSPPAEDLTRFRVDSPLEIERLLRGMMERKALITGSGRSGNGSFITTVLAVDGAARQFYLECPFDRHMDADLAARRELCIVLSVNSVLRRWQECLPGGGSDAMTSRKEYAYHGDASR